ncbi:MAG: winged helix DNA-binding protein [Dehalococcoidia bacterium]|nr:winged helix DNA-binding protein [Dehalococcoidia bacterium]
MAKDKAEDMDITRNNRSDVATMASLILSQAFVNWHKAFMRVLDPYKLTYSQWIIMHTLMATGESMSPSELNRYLTIEGTSISVVIDGIERRGLIQRRRSRADRRVVKVRLTAEGHALLNEIDSQIGRLINEIFGPLTAVERKQLIALCRRIRDASITHNGGDIDEVENILLRFSGAR